MYKQIDEDERQNMPLHETLQPHFLRYSHTDSRDTTRFVARCVRDVVRKICACCFCVGGCWYVVRVCVFLYGDHRERQKRVEKLNICALRTYVGVGLFAWSHLNSRFCAFNSLRFTSKRQKETDTKICIRTNVFVIKRIFSQRLASKPVLTHVRGKQELIEAHYSDVLQTSQRLNQISGWASLTSAAVCSSPLRSNLMATLARDSS